MIRSRMGGDLSVDKFNKMIEIITEAIMHYTGGEWILPLPDKSYKKLFQV